MIIQKNIKNEKGITLIILVVTIAIMMLLAGSTINLIAGKDGILNQAAQTEKIRNEQMAAEGNQTNTLINDVGEEIKNVWKDPSGANPPKLSEEMVPVKWDETKKVWVVTNAKDSEWFDYSKKKWANVMLRDGLEVDGVTDIDDAKLEDMNGKSVKKVGSMFVWIPRYCYQIESGYHSNTVGKINIEFMIGTTNASTKGRTTWKNSSGQENWNIHPAFEHNGIVEGIWVAKFEASQSDATAGAFSDHDYTGGTTKTIKIQPGVNSWRNIDIIDMYKKCLEYKTDLNSHMMTNYEWGAIAYLTQSIYGKNENVWINPNSNCITGQAGSIPDETPTASTNSYETENGVQASTTGNIYGVYDMSGGSWECVAAYLNNGSVNLDIPDDTAGSNIADYYKNIYNIGDPEGQENNYNVSANSYGDAMYETSASGTEKNSWNGDYSTFLETSKEFLLRGGGNSDKDGAGIFCFYPMTAEGRNDFSFRPVLSIF